MHRDNNDPQIVLNPSSHGSIGQNFMTSRQSHHSLKPSQTSNSSCSHNLKSCEGPSSSFSSSCLCSTNPKVSPQTLCSNSSCFSHTLKPNQGCSSSVSPHNSSSCCGCSNNLKLPHLSSFPHPSMPPQPSTSPARCQRQFLQNLIPHRSVITSPNPSSGGSSGSYTNCSVCHSGFVCPCRSTTAPNNGCRSPGIGACNSQDTENPHLESMHKHSVLKTGEQGDERSSKSSVSHLSLLSTSYNCR